MIGTVPHKNKLSSKQLQVNSNWTAAEARQGWRHYRISGRRYTENKSLELEMMAVCEREIRFWVAESELRDPSMWRPGWN